MLDSDGRLPVASPRRGQRCRWAQLLARVYGVHPLRCPACHGEPSSPIPQSSDHPPAPAHPGAPAPRSVRPVGRRRPSCWRSIRPHPGIRRPMGTTRSPAATPSISACPETTGLGAPKTQTLVARPPPAHVMPNGASRRPGAPSDTTRVEDLLEIPVRDTTSLLRRSRGLRHVRFHRDRSRLDFLSVSASHRPAPKPCPVT